MSRQPNELKKRSGPELVRQRELQDHERAILASLRSFIELGRHLGAINRDKLYRDAGFERFEDYVESRFDISRQHAYRLIEGARAALTVSPNGDKITSEAAARELVPLSSDPDKMRAVFAEAEARANGGRITAAAIRDVREEMYPGIPVIEGEVVPDAPVVDPVSLIPDDAKRAIEAQRNRIAPVDEPEEDHPGTADLGEVEDRESSTADGAATPSDAQPQVDDVSNGVDSDETETEDAALPQSSAEVELPQEQLATGVSVAAPAGDPERSGWDEEQGQAAASVPALPGDLDKARRNEALTKWAQDTPEHRTAARRRQFFAFLEAGEKFLDAVGADELAPDITDEELHDAAAFGDAFGTWLTALEAIRKQNGRLRLVKEA